MFFALTAAAASLADFEAALAAKDSATAALQQWCEMRHIAAPAEIRATRVNARRPRPPSDLRRRLQLAGNDRLAFRHVRLSCGGTVMSEAYNWYVPARLTTEMNTVLDGSDRPFGAIAAPLRFRRERLAAPPRPDPLCPRGTILAHRARLVLPDGRPLALLAECYTQANIAQ